MVINQYCSYQYTLESKLSKISTFCLHSTITSANYTFQYTSWRVVFHGLKIIVFDTKFCLRLTLQQSYQGQQSTVLMGSFDGWYQALHAKIKLILILSWRIWLQLRKMIRTHNKGTWKVPDELLNTFPKFLLFSQLVITYLYDIHKFYFDSRYAIVITIKKTSTNSNYIVRQTFDRTKLLLTKKICWKKSWSSIEIFANFVRFLY